MTRHRDPARRRRAARSPAAPACSPRWRRPTSTSSSSGARPTPATCPARPRLWTAGSRAFGPGCVLVARRRRDPPAEHLGRGRPRRHPARAPLRHLVQLADLPAGAAGHRGAATARTVATDGLTPSAAQHARRRRSPTRRARRRRAAAATGSRRIKTARGGRRDPRRRCGSPSARCAAAEAALAPGVTERQLTGVFMEAMAVAGVTTPASQDVAWITSRQHPWHRASRDVPVARRRPGRLRGRRDPRRLRRRARPDARRRRRPTRRDACAAPALATSCCDRLLAACRPGAPASDLLDAYAAAGVRRPRCRSPAGWASASTCRS